MWEYTNQIQPTRKKDPRLRICLFRTGCNFKYVPCWSGLMNTYWTEGTTVFWEIISLCSVILSCWISMCWNVLYADNQSGCIEDFIIVRFLTVELLTSNIIILSLKIFVLMVCFPLYITLLLSPPTFCWKSFPFFSFYISLINREAKEYWECWILMYSILFLQ